MFKRLFMRSEVGERFEKGESYMATPCLEGLPQRIVTVTGRSRGAVTFSLAHPIAVEWVRELDGREVARVRDENGIDYTVSAAVLVPLAEAQRVMACAFPKSMGSARRG